MKRIESIVDDVAGARGLKSDFTIYIFKHVFKCRSVKARDGGWIMLIEKLGDRRECVFIRDYKRLPKEPGVYILTYVENGEPKAFARLNGIDDEGILLIGKTVNLRRRVREFYKDILSEGLEEKYHSEGWNFRAYFRDNKNPHAIKLKAESIRVHWTPMKSEKEAYRFETQLIQDYVTKFQDKPPLNISIKRQRKV
jgi:hypothetical protein